MGNHYPEVTRHHVILHFAVVLGIFSCTKYTKIVELQNVMHLALGHSKSSTIPFQVRIQTLILICNLHLSGVWLARL